MKMYTDVDYKRIEAMYHKKYDNNFIISSMSHLPKFVVIEVIQTIEGRINVRKEIEYKRYLRDKGLA